MDDATSRRQYRPLSPDEEQEFRRVQAKYEAAYRSAGEPRVLFDAIAHVWWTHQTLPRWLVPAFGEFIAKSQTGEEAERFRERMRHVKRYSCVHELRRKYTKDEALDLAVKMLEGKFAGAARSTIEDSYWTVRRDLERRGRESEFFYYVDAPDVLIVDLTVAPGDHSPDDHSG